MENLTSETRALLGGDDRSLPTQAAPLTYVVHMDGGSVGDLAWDEAIRRARRSGATVVAVRILPPDAPRAVHQRSRAELSSHATEVGGGVDVKVVVVYGDPANELMRAIAHVGADLVILGHLPGQGPSLRFIDEVIRRAACPVLVVRDVPSNGTVIGGTDLSDPRLPVVSATCSEAATRSAGVAMVAHTVDVIPASSTRLPADIEDDIALDAALTADTRLRKALRVYPHALPVITHGPARSALVDLTEKHHAELLVVGTVGRTGIRRWLLGNLAEFVVRHVTCSVMVVRLQRDR